MTATAFAFDPALDRFDDSDGTGFDGSIPRRPELRLIQGEGYGRILPAAESSAPFFGPSVEVYRRRRFLALLAVTVMIVGIALAAGVSLTSFSTAPAAAASDTTPPVHVVLPGDSYAAIAADLGAVNPVAAGEQLRIANGDSELTVGQRLVVDSSLLTAGS